MNTMSQRLPPLPSYDMLARQAFASMNKYLNNDIHSATFGVISNATEKYEFAGRPYALVYAEVLTEVYRLKRAKDRIERKQQASSQLLMTFTAQSAAAMQKIEDNAPVFILSSLQTSTKPQEQLQLF